MAKRTEHELQIKIGGKVDSSLNKSVQDINSKMDSIGSTMKAVAGIAATAFASIKLKEWFNETVDASKEFEVSMAGVAKVVDGLKDDNGKITKSYYEMKDAILGLSKELPMTAENIASIVEAAGQSNVDSSELIRFAEDATKMGIAFDSTADQAGEWMAAWRTALDLDQDGVVTLADQINYLGNTTSENALKLSEVITRVGSLASTAGISASSVAALAASMTKVGSEVSATGIKNFSLALVAGESATKKQANTFKQLGLDAKNVAKSMQADSQGTILDVLERINKLSKEKQTSVMKNLFGAESLAAIAPLVANLDNLKTQFNKVGDAVLYAGSMEQEYIATSSTAANVDLLTSNKIAAMQIQIGDTLVPLSVLAAKTRGTLADMVSEFVTDNAPTINRTVKNIRDTIQENVPNVVYGLKSFVESGKEFLGGFRPLVEFIKDNPGIVPNFMKSIGTTMITYRVGKNIGEIAAGLKQVGGPIKLLKGLITNPWALTVGLVAGGIALIATNIASARKELRTADLAARFGDITLSLEDLNQIASQMLYKDNFSKLSQSLKIRDGLESLTDSVNEAIMEMNKLNWKVGIGLDLSEEEQESYKRNVTNFIASTQALLDDHQYALSLSLEVLTSDDETGRSILTNATEFYLENREVLGELGTQLQEVVNNAFSDGLLTIDEIETISNLQQQMAAITSKLAQSKFEATLEVMTTKLGTDLTPESYSNLIAEMQEQAKSTIADYDESLAMNIAYSKVRFDEGAINKEEYEKEITHFRENYLKTVGELNLTVSNFATESLFKAYENEIGKALPVLDKELDSIFGKYQGQILSYLNEADYGSVEFQFDKMYSDLKNLGVLSKAEQANLKNHYLSLLPTKEELEKQAQEYIKNNEEIPLAILHQLNTIYSIGALGGDEASIFTLLGSYIGSEEEYRDLIEKIDQIGIDLVPDMLLKALDAKNLELRSKTKEIKDTIVSELQTGINATMPVSIFLKEPAVHSNPISKSLSVLNNALTGSLGGHKDGGIFDTPHIAWFAEDGPEAAIPLDGSKEAIQLWQMAGQILGMFDLEQKYSKGISIPDSYQQMVNNTSTSSVSNNPTIKVEYYVTVEKGADEDKVQKAITMSPEQFDYMMSMWQKNTGRTSMAGGNR